MNPRHFFRAEALEAAEHFSDLQHSMQVTESAARFAGAAIVLFILVSITWSYFVFVPLQVSARGVLVFAERPLIQQVSSPSQGIVETIRVFPGEEVGVGDVLVKLRLPQMSNELEEQRRLLVAQEIEIGALRDLRALDRRADDASFASRRQALEQRSLSLTERLTWLEQRQGQLNEFFAKGLTTRAAVAKAGAEVAEVKDRLSSTKAELVELAAESEASSSRRRSKALSEMLDMERARESVGLLERIYHERSTITATASGTIVSVDAQVGQFVIPGDTIVDLEPSTTATTPQRLEAIVYIPLNAGKQVELADSARIAPSNLRPGDNSRLLGAVRSVSFAPVSDEALQAQLGNGTLVRDYSSQGPSFSARLSIKAPDSEPSGYLWTTTEGDEAELSPGTPISARITVDEVRLLTLALPALERLVGGGA